MGVGDAAEVGWRGVVRRRRACGRGQRPFQASRPDWESAAGEQWLRGNCAPHPPTAAISKASAVLVMPQRHLPRRPHDGLSNLLLLCPSPILLHGGAPQAANMGPAAAVVEACLLLPIRLLLRLLLCHRTTPKPSPPTRHSASPAQHSRLSPPRLEAYATDKPWPAASVAPESDIQVRKWCLMSLIVLHEGRLHVAQSTSTSPVTGQPPDWRTTLRRLGAHSPPQAIAD